MGEEVFRLHVATPTYAILPVSLQIHTRDKLNRVFFPCWCFLQCPTFICNGNQTKWPLVIKHLNWVDKHQMSVTKYGSHHFIGYGEKCNLPTFPL